MHILYFSFALIVVYVGQDVNFSWQSCLGLKNGKIEWKNGENGEIG